MIDPLQTTATQDELRPKTTVRAANRLRLRLEHRESRKSNNNAAYDISESRDLWRVVFAECHCDDYQRKNVKNRLRGTTLITAAASAASLARQTKQNTTSALKGRGYCRPRVGPFDGPMVAGAQLPTHTCTTAARYQCYYYCCDDKR